MPEMVVVVGEDELAVEAEADAAVEAAAAEEAPEKELAADVAVVEEQELEPVDSEELPAVEEDEETIEEEEEAIADIDDLSRSIVDRAQEPVKEKKKGKIVVVSPVSDEEDEKSAAQRGRSYVFDEKIGEVVVKRKRKGSRRRADWEEELDENDLE
jgi:hypothetical protein